MVRKKLATVVAALGALQAGVVSALGIGELTLQSALNQPLVAEIEILNTEDLDSSQVLVKLADPRDFKNAGIGRDFFLTNIRFKVELDEKGGGIIKLSTKDSVVEPYLNFLVETRWPSGRLLREFTVLMDLPVFSESQARPVDSASSGQANAPAPVASAATNVRPARPAPIVSTQQQQPAGNNVDRFGGDLEGGGEYRVRNDDTLWDIAVAARPSSQYSIQQTMLSIQRLNPDAFANGNINRLKAGNVLRLPTEDEIANTNISRQQAVNEVASQNRSWRTGSDGAVADGGAQLDATGRDFDDGGRFQQQDRLSIAAAGDSQSRSVGDGESAGAGGSQALGDQLALNQEELDKTRLEKQELESRLGDVEAKLATVQRLLELKSDQLAALQRAQGLVEDIDDPSLQVASASGVVSSLPVEEDPDELEPGLDGNPTAEEIAAAVLAKRAEQESGISPQGIEQALNPPPQQPVPVAPPPMSLVDKVLGNPLYLGGIGLLLLAAIAVVILRRRRQEEDEFDLDDEQSDMLADVSFDDNDFLDTNAERTEGQTLEADSLMQVEEDFTVADVTDLAHDNATTQIEQSAAVQPETEDAISEADIYVAYGRYQQAVDLLRSAINQEPQRSDLQLKLLEVYVETRDKPSFQQQYMQLETLGDVDAIAQVKEMLSTVDGVADWLDNLPGSEGATSFTDEDMDADLIEGDVNIELELDEPEFTEAATELADVTELADATQLADASDATDFDSLDLELDLDDGIAKTSSDKLGEISLELEDSTELGEFSLELDNATTNIDATSVELDDMELDVDLDSDDGFDLDLDNTDGTFDLDLADLTENSDLSELEVEFGESQQTVSAPLDELDLATELELPEDDDDSIPDTDFTAITDLELDDPTDVATAVDPAESAPVADKASAKREENFAESVASAASDEDFDFLSDTDEVATKLDLARAYIDMGDNEGAKDILDEVMLEGSTEQKQEADSLIERIV